jgi:hypothetical protein
MQCTVRVAIEHQDERRAVLTGGVRVQAEALAGLVARCGGQVLADVSPSGGRHVFVLFASPLPWLELRDVARALARPSEMRASQITAPGRCPAERP